MKRVIMILCITISVFLLKYTILAGEELAFMESNNSPQDSLVVGKISDINYKDKSMKIDVIRIVVGKLCKKNIVLKDVEIEGFNIGNGILLSANFLDNRYYECQMAYGYYKVDLKENKKIKCIFNSKMSESQLIELEWFVNTGRGTSSVEGRIYSLNQYGENELIYDEDKHQWLKDSLDNKYVVPDVCREWKNKVFSCILGALIIICLIWWRVVKRKRKSSG